jgi:competence protein ComEC
MTGYALAFLTGTLVRLAIPDKALALVTIVSVIAVTGWMSGRWRGVLWVSGWACAGWLLAWMDASAYHAARWPEAQAGDRALVEAVVETIPTISAQGTSFDALVRVVLPGSAPRTQASHTQAPRDRAMRAYVPHTQTPREQASRAYALQAQAPLKQASRDHASFTQLAPAQRVRCQFSPLSASGCVSEFRVRLIWRDRYVPVRAGERWQLLVSLRPPRSHFNPGMLDMELHWFRERVHALGSIVESRLNRRIDAGHRPLTELRQRVVERIRAHVADRDAAALISALAVGSTGDMSREQWRVFNATGTTHLVAISGLHVTLFALIALALARALWRALIWRFSRVPRETFASMFGLAAATAYALLAGFSVPTQRTLIMLAVWLIARSTARACGPLTTLSLALMLVLQFDPFAPLASGFWLSFGAIAAIVLVTHGRVGASSRWREALRVQVAVSLALIPVTLASFGSIPITGLLVNVVAIPFFSFLLVPLVLLAMFSDIALQFAAWLYLRTWPALAWASSTPFSSLHASPSLAWCAAAVGAIAISLLPLPMQLRIACLLWLLPSARTPPESPPLGGVDMTVLDVGQRTAIIIRTATHALFYGDPDNIADPSSLSLVIDPATARDRTWHWDAVSFRVRCPTSTEGAHCVMHITTSKGGLLLTSRTDADAERHWVRSGLEHADVVIIPRHGGNVASSPEFIATVSPRWAFVSGSSYFQHQIKPAIERWTAAGAQVLATADSGAIQLRIDPVTGVLAPVAARKKYLALWRASP